MRGPGAPARRSQRAERVETRGFLVADTEASQGDVEHRLPNEHMPMKWSNPETQAPEGFDMLLRDELPAAVREALDAVSAP